MLGAIIGDMVGAPYEFDRGGKTKDFSLWTSGSRFTDDTLTCIAGGIAETFYGIPEDIEKECRKRLPGDMLEVVDGAYREWYK